MSEHPRLRAPTLEWELLLCCARRRLEPGRHARLRELAAAQLDWTRLLDVAWLHGLVPLLHAHLEAAADLVPGHVRARLKDEFAQNARWNLFLMAELERLLGRLRDRGVPAVPFKGPVLGEQLYGSLALRECGDLDIAVEPRHTPAAEEVLLASGYRPALALTTAQKRAVLRSQKDLEFVRGDPPVVVELHWAFTGARDRGQLDMAELLSRARWTSVAGVRVPVFDPNDQLLLLCLHGSRHMWERLEWLCSVAELLRQGEADPVGVVHAARRIHTRRMVLLGLALGRDLLEAPLPTALERAIAGEPAIGLLAARAAAHLFRRGERWSFSLGGPFHRFQLHLRDGAYDRARYLWRALIQPAKEDFAALRLPDPLFPVYSVVRPIRLSVSYLRRQMRGAA